jgi:hypothetical protein
MKPEKRLTKKLRHEIYVKALEIAKQSTNKRLGLCAFIDFARKEIGFYLPDPFFHMEKYVEIYKRKPERAASIMFWWPISHKAVRIKVLKEAIEETK